MTTFKEKDDDLDLSKGTESTKRRRKPGIIYLSTIPPSMDALKLRLYFSKLGQVDKIYLQPVDEQSSKKGHGKMGKRAKYAEGWIEFKSKRKAKLVHVILNNQPIGGKKSNPEYDMLWNIKYLPRFKWAYLKQRLEYESQIRNQRMRTEILQVNKETDHYIQVSEVSDNIKKKQKKMSLSNKNDDNVSDNTKPAFVFKQKLTEEEILKKKEAKKQKNERFKKKLIVKKKLKKQEFKEKRKPKPDDLLRSVFVGSEN